MVSINGSASLFSSTNIQKNSGLLSAAQVRLSAGKRLTAASDDIAALAAGTALSNQVNTLRTSLSNVSQASSVLQVANGGLTQQLEILQRQKSLAQQASSGQLPDSVRAALNQEFQGLSQELTRIANSTNFNGVPLLNGGLNTTVALSGSDAQSATFQPNVATGSNASSAAASSVAIQAFNTTTGASLSGNANAGNLTVTDSSGVALSNAAFNNVNSSLAGGVSNFSLSNVNYGVSATITATIGGQQYSGTYTDGSTTAVLTNGSTSVSIATGTSTGAAAALNISSAAAVSTSEAGLNNVFANTQIQRVQSVTGVDFTSTALAGVNGGANGVATLRLNSSSANIENFRYTGNSGANNNTISVDINGQTFTASGVKDALSSGSSLVFQSADNQFLKIDLAGLTNPFNNIRTDSNQRDSLINGLNSGFAKAGSGLDVTASGNTPLNISLDSTTAGSLFNGQSVDISSQASAQASSAAIDAAIRAITSAQANVGSLQSQFDAEANALTSAIQTQDEARSNLLDTDISAESTRTAAARLQLEASIATQAQTKKLNQGLLKLL
ncbi:MAG: flagellin [Rickettsiales bacterium]